MEEEKKKRFVISYKNIPSTVPFWQTLVLFLLYDHFPPENMPWKIALWTIIWLFIIILWIGAIYNFSQEVAIDIFTPEKKDVKKER